MQQQQQEEASLGGVSPCSAEEGSAVQGSAEGVEPPWNPWAGLVDWTVARGDEACPNIYPERRQAARGRPAAWNTAPREPWASRPGRDGLCGRSVRGLVREAWFARQQGPARRAGRLDAVARFQTALAFPRLDCRSPGYSH